MPAVPTGAQRSDVIDYEIHGNEAVLHGYFVEYLAHGILTSNGSGSPKFGVRSIQLIE
mgnify:CR=1 FL=1